MKRLHSCLERIFLILLTGCVSCSLPDNTTDGGECSVNPDCSSDKACVNNRCVDPCEGAPCLFSKTECRVVDHRPMCACLKGYVLTGMGCKPFSFPKCQADFHCPEDRACREQRCVDPCKEGVCGNNTICSVKNHLPVCACKVGFLGDALHECVPYWSVGKASSPVKKTYFISDSQASWFGAMDACYSCGMNLATINDEQDWSYLKEMLTAKYPDQNIWIGGHNFGNNRTFIWAPSGRRLSYTEWDADEPYGYEDYHCLVVQSNYKWVSQECDRFEYFACEKLSIN